MATELWAGSNAGTIATAEHQFAAATSNQAAQQEQHGYSTPLPAGNCRALGMPLPRQGLGNGMGEKEKEYSTQEAADLLGIASRTTIWQAFNNGDIRGRKQGRRGAIKIPHSALVEYAKRFGYPIPEEKQDQ